jgi:hypothetical protein
MLFHAMLPLIFAAIDIYAFAIRCRQLTLPSARHAANARLRFRCRFYCAIIIFIFAITLFAAAIFFRRQIFTPDASQYYAITPFQFR